VPTERIAAVLASIALAEADVAVTRDGRFRLGPLAGAHRPERARYVGATARARHRAERIAAIEAERAEHEAERASAEATIAAFSDLLDGMADAVAALPSPAPAREARTRLISASGAVEQAERARVTAARDHATAQRARTEATRTLRRVAAEHGVPWEPDEVRGLQAQLASATATLSDYRTAAAALAERDEALQDAMSTRDAREDDAREAAVEHTEADRRHAEQATRLKTLTNSLGTQVAEILARSSEPPRGAPGRRKRSRRRRRRNSTQRRPSPATRGSNAGT